MTEPERSAAIVGWYTLDQEQPQLLGSRCTGCGTYFFPPLAGYCRNPACESVAFESVPLSRTGRIWSFTNSCYQPPEPYVAAVPFVPYAIAAVELEREKMTILGQVIEGVGVESLAIGMEMELVIQTLYRTDTDNKLIWKWRPLVPDSDLHAGTRV